METIKDQLLFQSLTSNRDRLETSPLISGRQFKSIDAREPRMESRAKIDISPNARRYYVEDLGEDTLLVDSSKKNPTTEKTPVIDLSVFQKGDFPHSYGK